MTARVAIVHSTAIYIGREYLGDLAELATGQWAAFDADANRLGVFDDRAEAERLVLSLRREKGGADG